MTNADLEGLEYCGKIDLQAGKSRHLLARHEVTGRRVNTITPTFETHVNCLAADYIAVRNQAG